MDTVFIVAPQSRLIGNFRAGGRSRRRQAKGLPPRASLRTEVFTSVRWEMAGWLEMSYGWRTHRPFLSNAAATTRSHRATPESAARTLAASVQVAITWRGAPPKEGTPGDISPPIRPSTATSQAPRVGCCTNHIRARLQISCRSPQPHSWNRPLPTWDLQLLPTEPPGALWVSARIPHGFPASPASCKDTERAIPSN